MITGMFSQLEIKTRVAGLAQEISKDYIVRPGKGRSARPVADDPVILLIVLKGAAMFGVDLARALAALRVSLQVEYCSAASYGNERTSSGSVKCLMPEIDFRGRRVLIVEDIIDTGLTLDHLTKHLVGIGASVRSVAFLDKHSERKIAFEADYTGIRIGNTFVVGYGMDDKGLYRELPFIGRIEEDVPTGTNDYYPKQFEDSLRRSEGLQHNRRGA